MLFTTKRAVTTTVSQVLATPLVSANKPKTAQIYQFAYCHAQGHLGQGLGT